MKKSTNTKKQTFITLTIAQSMVLAPVLVQAQVTASAVPAAKQSSVIAAIDRALQKNPELQVKIYAMDNAYATSDVVYGDMLPRVDARGAAGRERSDFDGVRPTITYNNRTYGIEARQLLFNGFSSQSAYQRELATARSRYFEVEEAAGNLSLEVARAYLNVARFKALVRLAEENYQRHQTTLSQIQKKVEAGIGRRSDLDQTIGRISLALSNVTTERNNLFSAQTQYQRFTGENFPDTDQGDVDFDAPLNSDTLNALRQAFSEHPSIRAATARLEATSADVAVANGAFFPRVDFRARHDNYSNYLATQESRAISAVELLAQLNLYKGGSDLAQQRVAASKRSQMGDERIRVCNSVRQALQAAQYDVQTSNKKISYLEGHLSAVKKARAAYIQQFEVGQRTLLDLLDADNEMFQAERSIINAKADRSIATIAALNAQGKLLETMGITTIRGVNIPERRALFLAPNNIAVTNTDAACPEDLLQVAETPLPDAAQLVNLSGQLGRSSILAQSDQPGAMAVDNLPGLPSGAGGIDKSTPSDVDEVTQLTQEWATRWSTKDVSAYLGKYGNAFRPEGMSRSAWEAQRRNRLSTPQDINVQLSGLQVAPSYEAAGAIEARFIQRYRSATHKDTTQKTLIWAKENGQWKIIREKSGVASASSKRSSRSS